jgi:hypothetical protein
MNCVRCGEEVPPPRAALGYRLCLPCGEKKARQERAGWCILTPHKQGAMLFTPEFAREAARGINNKGGLHR